MNIIVRDNQGLGTLLMMEGYSRERIIQAKNTIRQLFAKAANVVFVDVLGGSLPDNILIDISQNDTEELDEDKWAKMASFEAGVSRKDNLVFIVKELVLKIILQEDAELEGETLNIVFHEMIHAADFPMQERIGCKLERLYYAINDAYAQHGFQIGGEDDSNIALYGTLAMLEHYRSEGLAIMGSHLLLGRKFKYAHNVEKQFSMIFRMTLSKARGWIYGDRSMGEIFDGGTSLLAYVVSPSIMLMVLGEKGYIGQESERKALVGLKTGDYDLSDDDIKAIIRSSFSLGISDYIQGLVNLGDDVAPIRELLEFCASFQDDWESDNIDAFVNLVQQPEATGEFTAAMKQIMGYAMSEDELDEKYRLLDSGLFKEPEYAQLRAKVDELYHMLKNDVDANNRRIAQWALTYFFDEQDVIHDDIVGLGLVDDMTVIDYALRLIENN